MNTARRGLLTAAFASLAACVSAQAPTPGRRRVFVTNGDDSQFTALLVFDVKERLSASARFLVVDSGRTADVMVGIDSRRRTSNCGALSAVSFAALRLPDLLFLGNSLLLVTDDERPSVPDQIVASIDRFNAQV